MSALLQTLREQEEKYQFQSFSREDAFRLGLKLNENAQAYAPGVAIEITINGMTVFKYMPEGTALNNAIWLERKKRTVTQFDQSSLRVMAEFEACGETPADQKLDADQYALGGGGFPLRIKGTGMVGVIAVSGLPHMDDHQLIVDTLEDIFES